MSLLKKLSSFLYTACERVTDCWKRYYNHTHQDTLTLHPSFHEISTREQNTLSAFYQDLIQDARDRWQALYAARGQSCYDYARYASFAHASPTSTYTPSEDKEEIIDVEFEIISSSSDDLEQLVSTRTNR